MLATEEQSRILDAAARGCSMKIVAGPGTGKSTTLRMVAESLPRRRFLYLVYNKKNEVEARAKMPSNVYVSTANAMGYRAIVSDRDLELSDISPHMVAHEGGLSDYRFRSSDDYWKAKMLAYGVVLNFCRNAESVIDRKSLPADCAGGRRVYVDRAIETARRYWRKLSEGRLPMSHEAYMKLWMLSLPDFSDDFDCILYDEAQDADAPMMSIVNRQRIQKIIVGDPYQQIYAYRGSVDALNRMDVELEMTLTQSYRFGERIADLANRIIWATYGRNPGLKGSPDIDTSISSSLEVDAMIFRTNAAVIDEALSSSGNVQVLLDRRRIKEMCLSINALINGREPPEGIFSGFDGISELRAFCREHPDSGISGWLHLYMKHGYMDLMKFAKSSPASRSGSRLLLSAHKSKGLEFSNVVIGSDFKSFEDMDADLLEEANIQYVAVTRAMGNLDISRVKHLSNLDEPKEEAA